ncbi:MAG: signal peptide peptidase SppA, partial [Pseudomonadales bacterium]|nr:signal peptide peptidase SppA [Pseudomonadales bacterium]
RDLVDGLRAAADDERIAALVLDVDGFPGAAPATLRAIGDALDAFADSGKPVYSGADFLGQGQYLLASHATHLYLNPLGQVSLRGFASQPAYFASALDKLRVNVHVFRVGEYKSAVEPLLRDDMSDLAREAEMALVQGLWSEYRDRIARNRRLPPEALDALLEDMPSRLRAVQGDFARLALETGLVDELLTRDAFRARLVDLVGEEEESGGFRGVDLRRYVAAVRMADLARPGNDTAKVGVVVAEGTITGGRDESQVGEETAALIREARRDPDIAALVVRVNSPGGSAFFSEVLRKELELAQLQGKPVVASFGGIAASGGYWMAATADRIFAEPDTITGSIGIFGLLPTFEESAEALGVNSDGVGTHPLSGAGNVLEPINPAFADLLQQSVERGYERFIDVVARGRGMTAAEVDAVAQGRVWLGRTAQELGLVDELGGIDAAAQAAAEAAGLADWDLDYLRPPRSARDQLLARMFASPAASWARGLMSGPTTRWVEQFSAIATSPLELLGRLDDPRHVYALCALCPRTP